MGVDPGLAGTGWGVVQLGARNVISLLGYGAIVTKPSQPLVERLKLIYDGVTAVIRQHRPAAIAIEELFFCKEAKTVAAVGQARGAILIAAANENVSVHEYNPRSIKMALTGYGSADKTQIQYMVKMLLRMQEIPKPDHAADALAMAVCHLHSVKA